MFNIPQDEALILLTKLETFKVPLTCPQDGEHLQPLKSGIMLCINQVKRIIYSKLIAEKGTRN